MKTNRRILHLVVGIFLATAVTRAQDIPIAIPDIKTAPAGTLVIAMDNINQAW